MSDLLVAFITTTSVLSDVSAAQKEEVVAFMQKRGYDAMSWDKIRYVSCFQDPAKLLASPDYFLLLIRLPKSQLQPPQP